MSAYRTDRRVFVDTAGWFAYSNRNDADHDIVLRRIRELGQQRQRFITTNFVIAELHALIIRRGPVSIATPTILRIVGSPATVVVRVRSKDEERALNILQQYSDKQFSYTDVTSFAVMERLDMTRALSLDHHFAQYGWDMVPLDDSPAH